MDDIQKRLSETAKTTLETYEAWSKTKTDDKLRETLSDAVHELRKVASRVEIEMAVSERDEQSRNRIPIPPHRSKKPAGGDKKPKDGGGNGGNEKPVKKIELGNSKSGEPKEKSGSRPRRKAGGDN